MTIRAILCFLFLGTVSCLADPRQESDAGITHSFLATGAETYIISGDGKVTWTYPAGTRDGWVLPSGNLLLALSKSREVPGGGAAEVTRDGEVVFTFKGTQSEVNTVQAVGKDRYLLTEAGPKPRLLEVDRSGKVLVEVPLDAQTKDTHLQTRMSRKLKNGNYLVPQLLDKVVREYTPAGKIVWSLDQKELPGITLAWVTTLHALPDGNIIVGNCHAGPDNPQLFEITRDKKVAWTFKDFTTFGNSLAAAHVLGLPEKTVR